MVERSLKSVVVPLLLLSLLLLQLGVEASKKKGGKGGKDGGGGGGGGGDNGSGSYRVSKNKLLDPDGKAFLIRGVTRPSLEWRPDGESLRKV